MKNVLIVEDSPIILKILRKLCKDNGNFIPIIATSYSEAEKLINDTQNKFFATIVDMHLPDAQHGEIVDLALESKIPTIVLTGSYDEQKRETLFAIGVVDYVVKESRYSYEYAIGLINRLKKTILPELLMV